ncbi:MAG: deoxyribose-phosphate aldolase [Elusimicrobiales bacterium]|jgi:deoxyribose-phosphate aldolase|nr:deoxyribose-phosphate aldolase [Elusimicrobiales bacterium]
MKKIEISNPAELAPYIDHTLLKANATIADIKKLCDEAIKYHFASVCINPFYVSLASGIVKGSGVKVCTVIGFPLGSNTSLTKVVEARDAIAAGADEIDMVINIPALKSGDYTTVLMDIEAIRKATEDKVLKVIIETTYLKDDEKIKACNMAKKAGADFVKTSTGFGPSGATVEDVKLMRKTVGPDMGVKASGGIRDYKTAADMIMAGATRIGASASVSIVSGQSAGEGKY